MKTYFKYEGLIKSKEAAEAIAAPIALGPFCGFGSAKISGNKLSVQSKAEDGKVFKNDVADRIAARYLVKNSEDGESPDINFGCISRDGYIFISDDNEIVVDNIQGAQGSNSDVFLFAVHQEVTEPIENPITFVAYWSSSYESFYTLYKQSQNPYYPLEDNKVTWDVIKNNPAVHDKLNYSYLISQVEGACEPYRNGKNTMVLIGIYGTGTDANTRETENYAIIPYGGSFPQPLSFTTATNGIFQKSLSRVEKVLEGFGGKEDKTDGIFNIKNYLDSLKEEIISMIKSSDSSVPSGVIAMFSGTNPPEGWAFCDGLAGRPNLLGKFVVGYNPSDPDYDTIGKTGGESRVTLTVSQIPAHHHNIAYHDVKWGDNANKRPFPYGHNSPSEGWFPNGVDTRDTGGGQSHENRPPYFVLAYIIKL